MYRMTGLLFGLTPLNKCKGFNNLPFVWNIHAAFETMNTSLRQTSPLFEQYLNECSEVCHNKIGTVSLMCSLFQALHFVWSKKRIVLRHLLRGVVLYANLISFSAWKLTKWVTHDFVSTKWQKVMCYRYHMATQKETLLIACLSI